MKDTAKTDYSKGKIYMLWSDLDDDIYVGSTTYDPVENRLVCHRSQVRAGAEQKVYVHFRALGEEHMFLEVLEDYPCASEQELLRRERKWFDLLKPTLNVNRPWVTRQEDNDRKVELSKGWREANRERFNARARGYYQTNAEKLRQRTRDWRAANPGMVKAMRAAQYAANHEAINARKREKIPCVHCGTEIARNYMATHVRRMHSR